MIRSIQRIFRSTVRNIAARLREEFASYIVWDDHGTLKACWTMREAMDWLPYCGGRALIINAYSRVIEVSRVQTSLTVDAS